MNEETISGGPGKTEGLEPNAIACPDSLDFVESMIVYDEEEECPYLPGRTARMPLRFPIVRITNSQTDGLLSNGFRRSGRFLYQTRCPACSACEATRIDIARFQPNRSQRRALKKGNAFFDLQLGQPVCSEERVDLFNKHRNGRGLNRKDNDIEFEEYEMFLAESCLDSLEMTYWVDGQLGAVAICDLGDRAVSAVYTYYDPQFESYSPGTYSIMKQIEYCQKQGFEFLYLGFFVEGSQPMIYKQNFLPQQRLQAGKWKEFERNTP